MSTRLNHLAPPIAARKPTSQTVHGVTLDDPYAWLQDPNYPAVSSPEILQHLEAENRYFADYMAPLQATIDTLVSEMKGRQVEEDASVPYTKNGFLYQWRFHAGQQYRSWYRAAVTQNPTDEPDWHLLLDENDLASGHDYFRLGNMAISPCGKQLAYSTDTNGSERYTLYIVELASGAEISPPVENTVGTVVWHANSDALLYLVANESWRPDKVFCRSLAEPTDDPLVYHETDEAFFVSLDLSQSERYVFIQREDHVTSEVAMLPRNDFSAREVLISARSAGHEYSVEHQGDRLLILSNRRHANFDLFACPLNDLDEANWQPLIHGDEQHYLTGCMALADHVIITERSSGLEQIRILDSHNNTSYITLPEAAYTVGLGVNPNYETKSIRLHYASMTTPDTVYDYDLKTSALTTLKMRQIPSGYDAKRFITERLSITARDGVQVPLSLVRLKDTAVDAQAPLFLYGYGAYGHAIEPAFSSNIISLLERGFIFAIAHIRGGDDLGYHWYTSGKLEQRENTFNDFVDCARHLVNAGYTQADRLMIGGGSAGGELVGAAVNQAPNLFAAVVAHVPFVDVLNTMLNPALPLTPMEWPEWGNPIENADAFATIRNYSPYDQVAQTAYPPMLVTAGLNDPRVTYWEPAKWVAKLRYCKTDTNPIVLKINMGAGHGGQSGRFSALREIAEEYAFMLRIAESVTNKAD